MKFKKGQGLSMNMIIVAALAIIVLIVVVMIFSGKMRSFGNTMQSCESQGGSCGSTVDPTLAMSALKASCPGKADNYVVLKGTDCEDKENDARVCCKQILG
jgi:hypothetical protein